MPNRAIRTMIEELHASPNAAVPQNAPKPEIAKILAEMVPPQLQMSAKIADGDDGSYLKISIKAEDIEQPPPQDVVAVIDISGSMDASCAGVTDGKT